jgi:hypothetical protein
MKLGKLPATYSAHDLRFEAYRTAVLPPHPVHFGHEGVLPADGWGFLGNDTVGDCVFAGAAHETMLWGAAAGRYGPAFTDAAVIGDYARVTGFNPETGANDNGTDVRQAMSFRRKTGIQDASGKRHKIAAYLSIEPGNTEHLLEALYLFGVVGIGIEFPESAMAQFNAGKPWSYVRGAKVEGGHYVPLVARRHYLECVTWGRIQPLTYRFLTAYMDEAWALVSTDFLNAGKSPEGFALAELQADLAALK